MQKQTINELILKTRQVLYKEIDERVIDFEIPKTVKKEVAMSQYIRKVINDDKFENQEICFFWMSAENQNLCEKICENLKKEFGIFPDCYLLEQEFHGYRKTIMGGG